MKQIEDPQAAIEIAETYTYKIDLGAYPIITLHESEGEIEVKVPYDGTVFTPQSLETPPKQDTDGGSDDLSPQEHDGSRGDRRLLANPSNGETNRDNRPPHLGKFTLFADADTNTSVEDERRQGSREFPIILDKNWQRFLKEGKKFVSKASYTVDDPQDQLISIDGVVQDDLLNNSDGTAIETIFEDTITYTNPLALHLSLWVPDLLNETRLDEHHELETMILRGENTRRAFLSTTVLNFETRLAEQMAALANTSGGTILLGVERNRRVVGVETSAQAKQDLARIVLTAVLQSTPPISLLDASYIRHPNGKTVLRLDVARKEATLHSFRERIYRRQGPKNIVDPDAGGELTAVIQEGSVWEGSIEDVFNRNDAGSIIFKERDDVVVLDADYDLEQLRLGSHICGLINAGKRNGRVIVTNLPDPTKQTLRPLSGNRLTLETVLEKELKPLLPVLNPPPRIERRHIGGDRFAIIFVTAPELPIALYNGQGFQWQNPLLNEVRRDELLEKYLKLTSAGTDSFEDHDVYLEEAWLKWPIRPPEMLEQSFQQTQSGGLAYDVQHQAQVWNPRSFKYDEDTVGFQCQLMVPLRHVSLVMNDAGKISTEKPIVEGQLRVRFKDALISGVKTNVEATKAHSWFQSVPIYKRTTLVLDLKIRLNELFKKRQKSSLLRFTIPNVALNEERLHDLAHIFADIGFRIYETPEPDYDQSLVKATIRGIRSHNFYDIFLLAGLRCEKTELTRELRYEGWRDSKSTFTAKLDVRIKLWGSGPGVEQEIGRLHMQLYRTISQRLRHLHTE